MQRYNDKKNERKERSNMKTFRLRCKKLCAVVLMIVTAFGFSFATPKTAQAANTKYWIKVNKQANVATVYQLRMEDTNQSKHSWYLVEVPIHQQVHFIHQPSTVGRH